MVIVVLMDLQVRVGSVVTPGLRVRADLVVIAVRMVPLAQVDLAVTQELPVQVGLAVIPAP